MAGVKYEFSVLQEFGMYHSLSHTSLRGESINPARVQSWRLSCFVVCWPVCVLLSVLAPREGGPAARLPCLLGRWPLAAGLDRDCQPGCTTVPPSHLPGRD